MPEIPARDSNELGSDPWVLEESRHDPGRAALHETLFALGNGRIGVRGAHEEGNLWPGCEQDAVYINGFHETEDIRYPENAHGLARLNQFMVSVPNGKLVRWRIGSEAFDPATGSIADYRRRFDFRTGLVTRDFVWTSPLGRRVAVHSRRLVCLERAEVHAMQYLLRPLDSAARIVIESSLDARPRGITESDDPRVGSAHAARALAALTVDRQGHRITLTQRTRRSGLYLVSGIEQVVVSEGTVSQEACGTLDCPGLRVTVDLVAGQSVRIDKFCALVSSLDHRVSELAPRAIDQLSLARQSGFDALCAEQQASLARHWQDADVEIDGDAALQQGIRFNLLHLLQSAGRDGRTNIAAKGVTGSGYDGHYFWDTEIYVFPVMLHTRPDIARKLLEFRFNTLDAARQRARELDHRHGALFPWRTIAGDECSSYFPAGTAQFHINADIAFAVKRYWEATGDDEFMRRHGAELVFETARIWLELGHFEPGLPEHAVSGHAPAPRFVIHTVTGPDEYSALVDNNLYTNAMARMHLRFAADIARWLGEAHPELLRELAARIALPDDEASRWRLAADRMYLPYDAQRRIHPQDDGFLHKKRWDVAGPDAPKRPLLLHYHPLVIYRHQVCKQADVLLALWLLDDQFEAGDKRRDFDYYEPLTTHDSSLSRCIFGIVASEVGHEAKAYRYFTEGARTDLDDHHHNSRHGVHTAAMAGSWLGVVAGFGGLRMHGAVPSFVPRLPAAWSRCAFKLRIGKAQLQVTLKPRATHYTLLAGDSIELRDHGESIGLTAEKPHTTRPVPMQPPDPHTAAPAASDAALIASNGMTSP